MTYSMLKQRYKEGRISKDMLKNYVKAGHITSSEYEKITNEPYEEVI